MTGYEAAKAKYAALGVDTDQAIEILKKVPVSLHCWQLDAGNCKVKSSCVLCHF